jgi:branched-chain amino acid transport system ATP-binding protein
MTLEQIYGLFPTCASGSRSQGTKLSGGEQQMLAIGRILRTGARFLLLDEPTEGLAPVIVQQIGDTIAGSRRRASPSCWSSRIPALRRLGRRPPLRHGARPGGRPLRQPRSRIESRKLHGYLGV